MNEHRQLRHWLRVLLLGIALGIVLFLGHLLAGMLP
jgi:hypothetical protein